jgi:hypothetical protein
LTFGDDTEHLVYDGSGNVDFDSVGLDIDSSGAITIDGTSTVSIDGADDMNFTITSGTGGEDLTIQQIGANDSSIIITAAGTGTDAVSIDATAGDMLIAPNLINGKTLTIGPSSATQMVFTPHGTAANEKISLINTAGDATDAIAVTATAGGIDIGAGTVLALDGAGGIDIGKAADVAIDIDSAALDIDASGAIAIDTSAGGVSIDAAAASNFTTAGGAITIDGNAGISLKEAGTDVIAIDTARDILFSRTGGSSADPDVEFDGYVRFDGTTEVTDTTDSTSVSTGALIVDGGVGIAKDLVVGGMVTAQEFHSEFVSASIMYMSGSNKFGDSIDDIHSFSGSIHQSGSFKLNDGNMTIADTLTATNIGAFNVSAIVMFPSLSLNEPL